MGQEDYLPIPEVARRLKYHSQTIRDQVRAGTIPSIKVGNHYRIPVSWLNEQEAKASKKTEPEKKEEKPSGSTAVVQKPAPGASTEVKTTKKFQPKPSKAKKQSADWTPPLFANAGDDDDDN